MRTISDIKGSITADFMRNEDAARIYGFNVGDEFTDHFSTVSIENMLFYIVACSTYVMETLFAQYQTDVDTEIQNIIPHRPKWYRDKVLAFMKDKVLIPDTDIYDTTGMTDSDTATAQVVKYAVATENEDSSILTIKVAGENAGTSAREPLDRDTESQLLAYIGEIKDAGVRVALVNQEPDVFNCFIDVYYDAILQGGTVQDNVQATIASYIENLPFNGVYTNMALVDALQILDGVKDVKLISSEASVSGDTTTTAIDERYIPAAGYFTIGTVMINMKVWDEHI